MYSIIKIEINALSLKQLEYRVRIYIHCEILEMFKLESEVPIHMHNIQWNSVCEIYILLLLINWDYSSCNSIFSSPQNQIVHRFNIFVIFKFLFLL